MSGFAQIEMSVGVLAHARIGGCFSLAVWFSRPLVTLTLINLRNYAHAREREIVLMVLEIAQRFLFSWCEQST
jgi:hypothetical protein